MVQGRGGERNREEARGLVLDEPPSVEGGEVTDKRSLNTRRVLERRAADVARLYAEAVDRDVIVFC